MYLGGEKSFVIIVDGHYFLVDESPLYSANYKHDRFLILDVGSGARKACDHAHRVRSILARTLGMYTRNDIDMDVRDFVKKVLECRVDL